MQTEEAKKNSVKGKVDERRGEESLSKLKQTRLIDTIQ